jgi:hypothetical protein
MSFNLYIDSRNATKLINGSPSDSIFLLEFGQMNLVGQNYGVSVEEVSFPNLVYGVNSTNNTVLFSENSSATILSATIAPGNYTPTTFATAVKSALDTVGSNTYTVVYDNTSGKLAISANSTNTLLIRQVNDVIGFDISSAFATSITGDHPISISGSMYVDITSPSIQLPSRTTSNRSNILQRVYVDVPYGFQIRHSNSNDADMQSIISGNLNTLELRLFDDRGNPWTLPANAHFSMTLRLSPMRF